MRISRRLVGSAVAVPFALLALSACQPAATDGSSKSGSDSVVGAASAAASKAASSNSGIPADKLEQLRKGLPGNLSQEQVLSAAENGILVTTQSGLACQSKPLVQGANDVYIILGKLKPGGSYGVKVSSGSKVLLDGMKIIAPNDSVEGYGSLGEGHFSCQGWSAGHYQVDITTSDGSSLYGATATVQ